MKILRVSAAMQKKSEPRKKIWITVMERNGWRYHQMWPGRCGCGRPTGRTCRASSPKTSPLKQKTAGDEGAEPAAAQVGELGDRLGEDELIGVALKVAEDRGAEDRGDYDRAEEGEDDVEDRRRERPVEIDLVVADIERSPRWRWQGSSEEPERQSRHKSRCSSAGTSSRTRKTPRTVP